MMHDQKNIKLLYCINCTILYCIVPYSPERYCTEVYYTEQYCTVLDCTELYWTVLYVLYCTVLYCTALYCTLMYCTVLSCAVLYSTVLYWAVLYCTVLYSPPMLYIFLFSSSIMIILFHWMFFSCVGFWFSHIFLIRAGGCRTAFIATSLWKFLSSLWWLRACTECNTMRLQLPTQDDVAAGQYAQNFLGVADEKLQFTSPMILSTSKHTLSYYNNAGELQRVFFLRCTSYFQRLQRPYVRAVPTENQMWMASVWGFEVSRSSKMSENKYIK